MWDIDKRPLNNYKKATGNSTDYENATVTLNSVNAQLSALRHCIADLNRSIQDMLSVLDSFPNEHATEECGYYVKK